MVIKLNTARLNGTRLSSASLNGVGDRLRASAGGGGGVIIPPPEPEEPDTPVTYTLAATADNGKVSASVNGKSVTLPYVANAGDVVVMEVTADEGFMFEGWSDGNTDNPRSITMTADVTLSAMCVAKAEENKYIRFADPAVEAICVANWSSDGIGLTMEDAAKVTDIGNVFTKNTEIKTFNEFQYFTGVTTIGSVWNDGSSAFRGCSSLSSIVLPASLSELKKNAFRDCISLETINLECVKKIGYAAFYNASSLSVALNYPQLEELGDYAFHKSGITDITNFGKIATLPNSGSSDYSLFSYCSNLTNVKIEGVVTNTGRHAYESCSSLEKVTIGNNVTIVDYASFIRCKKLHTLDIGSGVTTLEEYLAQGCSSLQSIIVRAITPPTIKNYTFYDCDATFYVPDAALEVYKTATNWSTYADRIHPLSELEGSPYITFADAEVERVLMENNVSSDGVGITMADAQAVTSISNWFKGNTAITSFNELQYFTGLTALGTIRDYQGTWAAFSGCSNLTEVTLPASVVVLGNNAFKDCSSLRSINLHEGITSLDSSVFDGCSSLVLDDVNLPNLTLFSNKVFDNVKVKQISDLGKITALPDAGWGVNENYGDKATLEKVVLPLILTTIVNASFYQYVALDVVVCHATTPPTLASTNVFQDCPLSNGIYVPDASVDAYKAANNWSTYASQIKPLSEYNG